MFDLETLALFELGFFSSDLGMHRMFASAIGQALDAHDPSNGGRPEVDDMQLAGFITAVETRLVDLRRRLAEETSQADRERIREFIEGYSQELLTLRNHQGRLRVLSPSSDLPPEELDAAPGTVLEERSEQEALACNWSPADLRFVTGPIRESARQVRVYNDGLVVFLYDRSSAERIATIQPAFLQGFGQDALEDECLSALFESRALVLSLLPGDRCIDLEVVVGRKLTRKEISVGSWEISRSVVLELPSGLLEIHSYNTLPIGRTVTDEGASVTVPKGTYTLTLYRKDWDREEAAGRDWLEVAEAAGIDAFGDGRIDEVLVLTPRKTNRGSGGVLFPECL